MATEAQIKRNIQNAKHSTGPRTVEGKRRSRQNALVHGLTAKVVLLPDEQPAEFNKRVHMYFEHYLPQSDFEVHHTERTAFCSWQVDRCRRAGMARGYVQAVRGRSDEEQAQKKESIELAQILFRAPFGRAAACPFGALPDGESISAWPANYEPDNHPSILLIRLQANPFGAMRLLDEWQMLESPLLRGEAWGASQRFRAFRLLGIHATDACLGSDVTSLIHACEVLDPTAGSVIAEIWGELVSATDLPGLEREYRQYHEYGPAMQRQEALNHLIEIVRSHITKLEAKVQEHKERTEFLDELAPNIAAFDTSPEGMRILRYEFSWLRLQEKHENELRKRDAERRKAGQSHRGRYCKPPSEGWLLPEEAEDNAVERDENGCAGLPVDEGAAGTFAVTAWSDGEGERGAVAAAGRNEPKVKGAPRATSSEEVAPLRNEPKLASAPRATSSEEAAPLRNEPKLASALRTTSSEEVAPLRNEPKLDGDINERQTDNGEELLVRNEPSAEAMVPRLRVSLRADKGGRGSSLSFERSIGEVTRDLKPSLPRVSLGISGEFGRGSASGGGSRRERRRKKAEARARAK